MSDTENPTRPISVPAGVRVERITLRRADVLARVPLDMLDGLLAFAGAGGVAGTIRRGLDEFLASPDVATFHVVIGTRYAVTVEIVP